MSWAKRSPQKLGSESQRLDFEEQPRYFEGGNFTMPASQRIARLADCSWYVVYIFGENITKYDEVLICSQRWLQYVALPCVVSILDGSECI